MKVLIIEDSKTLGTYLSTALVKSNYAVDVEVDGKEGLWMAQNNDYGVIILDIMLPSMDGMVILKKLRESNNDTHIIMLTAMSDIKYRVEGLNNGADDYLVKPFHILELIARVDCLARRHYGAKSPEIKRGPILIDTAKRQAYYQEHPLNLNSREYMLLELLMRKPGRVFSRIEIENEIYHSATDLVSNSINSSVSLLRKAFKAHTSSDIIITRRGMGYQLGDIV